MAMFPSQSSQPMFLLLLFVLTMATVAHAIQEQFVVPGPDPQEASANGGQRQLMAKRRLFDLFSFLNKRRDSEFIGGAPFEALPPIHTRSLEHNNCYFSPIQCYLEERKRRSAPPPPPVAAFEPIGEMIV